MRVLSLAGGGYLGLYTARVLEALEAKAGEPIGRCFDLVAGTSIGGILALGVAYEIPMSRMVRLILDEGPQVFSSRALPSGTVGRLVDLTRSVLGPKYTGEALRRLLQAELGEQTLDEARHPVLLPAVDVTRCRTKIFKSPHCPASRGDEGLSAVDVAMATSAAPAYFPSLRIGQGLYADGGLFAVAPDEVALHECEHFIGVEPSRVSMLSIGTATHRYLPPEGVREDAGAVGWLSDGRLVMTLLSVQQEHVAAMMEDRLGERYLRLDADWPGEAGLGIDVATPRAAQTLLGLADATMKALDADRLAAVFESARASGRPRS